MAEEVKQRIRAKPQIQASAINNEDLLLMEHAPNTLEDSDKSVRMDQAKEYFIGDLEGKIQRANSRLDVVEPKVSAIENIIPNQATEDNQLADKDFVNSSVATNTANFIGSFDSLEELEAYEGTVTNNDYAFVKTIDDLGKEKDARYKYNASEEEWLFEYYLNNSSFTEAQWKAIDSGITAELVSMIGQASSSAPIGSIMMWFSPNSPAGWVFCNHTKLSISDYAELYEKLKDIPQCHCEEEGFFYTPDFRESVPVGAGENGTNVISAHDIYTLGQFKDDQFQDHSHYIYSCVNGNLDGGAKSGYQSSTKFDTESRTRNGGGTYTDSNSSLIIARDIVEGYGRHGTTTHGKQLGTNFIIKALNVTGSLDESVKVDDNKTTTGNVWSGAKVAEEIGKVTDYSTEETIIGYLKINGVRKPIYRIMINILNNFTGTNWGDTGINVNSLSIDKLIYKSVISNISNKITAAYQISKIETDGKVYVGSVSNTSIAITTNDFIVLEYTKTTD